MTAAAGQTPAQSVGGSFTLNLMRVRTFIALFAVLIFFSLPRRIFFRPPISC